MEGFVGVLAVAGGFGLALGLTALGMNVVLGFMPSKARRAAAEAREASQGEAS